MRRDPASGTSDLYEFRISLFDHGNPEYFLFFIQNFKMTFVATETLDTTAKVQCLCIIVCGKALRQFDLLSADVENMDTFLIMNDLLKGLVCYFPPLN